MQFINAIMAAVGLGYVISVAIALILGNRSPVIHYPQYTVFYFFLSGICLAILCRQRSARFWKIIDLIWVVTFIPSIVVTLLLHFHSETVYKYRESLNQAVINNQKNVEFWDSLQTTLCETPREPYVEACKILYAYWATFFVTGTHKETFEFSVESLAWDVFQEKKQDIRGASVVIDDGNLVGLGSRIYAVFSQINELNDGSFRSPIVIGSDQFFKLSTRVDDYYWALWNKRFFETQQEDIPASLITTIPEDLEDLRLLIKIGKTTWESSQSYFRLRDYYESRIYEPVSDYKFLPLIIACFIFPFRVGKSIYEIAANKDKKNAPISSLLDRGRQEVGRANPAQPLEKS